MYFHNGVVQLYLMRCDRGFVWENFALNDQGKILATPCSNNELDVRQLQEAFPGILNVHNSTFKSDIEIQWSM